MSDKHNEVIEVPGIRAQDHEDLVTGARVATSGSNLDSFIDKTFEAAEFFRARREKPVDKTP